MSVALKSFVSLVLMITLFNTLQFEVAGQFQGDRRSGAANWGGVGNTRGHGQNERQEATVRRGSDTECENIGRQYCPTDPRYHTRLLPNPYDCGSFCTCQTGRGRYMACPEGLHFSQAQQICTWPWEARCQ